MMKLDPKNIHSMDLSERERAGIYCALRGKVLVSFGFVDLVYQDIRQVLERNGEVQHVSWETVNVYLDNYFSNGQGCCPE